MSRLTEALQSLPAVPEGQTLKRESARRRLRYAVNVFETIGSMHVLLITVDAHGGMKPAEIKRELNRKALQFCFQMYPGRKLNLSIVGRVDHEMPTSDRPFLRYCAQIKDGPVVATVVLVCVRAYRGSGADVRIKEEFARKTLSFCAQKFPGKSMAIFIAGHVDYEIT